MAYKYYAVKAGRNPGIYTSWAECKKNVDGYKNPRYKGFNDRLEAEKFVKGIGAETNAKDIVSFDNQKPGDNGHAYCFVDGSFNAATGVYGYGGFVVANGEKTEVTGRGNDPEMASMRNVAGEVLGSTEAVKKAIELGICELDVYYDYLGIQMWATGEWKRNKKGTIAYYEYMNSIKDTIKLNFIKVKGHSGVEGNEEADQLAKKAVGIL